MDHDGRQRKPFPAKLFEGFSKRELQDFLHVLHCSLDAETADDIAEVLHVARKLVPGEKLIAGVVHVDPRAHTHQFSKIINISYHPDWIRRYLRNGYAQVDPVLGTHVRRFETQVWTNAYETARCDQEKEFIEEAKSFGLVNGITTGVLDMKRRLGSFFSFAGGAKGDNRQYADVLECLGYYLHHAMMKVATAPTAAGLSGLSQRELSVLTWMKSGKTNWEIARILGVTERTVRFHVERIFDKLDVASRTQAVAIAIEQGLLAVS